MANNAANPAAAPAAPKEIKTLADLLAMPVTILTRDRETMENVTIIDWNNNYGLVCQMVANSSPYWCYIPMASISKIIRKSNS